ncbi:MAG: biotin/lipoyl-containing protein, partial [Rhodoferax sp.]
GWVDPWAQRDGWRSHGASSRAFMVEFHDVPHTAQLTRLHGGGLQLQIDGQTAALHFTRLASGALDVRYGDQRTAAHVYQKGDVAHVFTAQGATQIVAIDALAHAGDVQGEAGRLTAPMPGKVVSFAVKAGDVVKKGQALAVMEAMKMEHTIAAPADGTVAELLFAPGDQVTEGAELLKLEIAA